MCDKTLNYTILNTVTEVQHHIKQHELENSVKFVIRETDPGYLEELDVNGEL